MNIETKIRQIIREEIEKAPDNMFNGIDLSSISINDFINGYKDYRLLPIPTFYGDKLYEPVSIKEVIGDIVPPDEVVERILKKYSLPQSFAKKVEAHNKIYIYVVTAVIGDNETMIINDMEKLGYFLSIKGKPYKVQEMVFEELQFEPTSHFQNDETDTVRQQNKYLYHWTPQYNLDKIMTGGLKPTHKNSYFTYPDRCYFMTSDIDNHTAQAFGQTLCIMNKDKQNDGNYVLLKIDLSKVDENVRFYYDPNSGMSIYTEQSIPSFAISVSANAKFPKSFK